MAQKRYTLEVTAAELALLKSIVALAGDEVADRVRELPAAQQGAMTAAYRRLDGKVGALWDACPTNPCWIESDTSQEPRAAA